MEKDSKEKGNKLTAMKKQLTSLQQKHEAQLETNATHEEKQLSVWEKKHKAQGAIGEK